MRKEEKAQAIAKLREKFSRVSAAFLAECTGLAVNEVTELRRQLRGARAELKVVKNTLAILAADGTPLGVAKEHFRGALSVAIGYDDPALPAKILRDFIAKDKRDKKMRITVGVVEGNLLDASRVKAVADLPPRNALLSMLLAGVQGPLVGLAGTLNGIVVKFVGTLIAIKGKPKEEPMPGATATKLSKEEFIKMIEGMTVLELDDYVKALQDRFGVTAAAPAAAPAGGGAAAGGPPGREKKGVGAGLSYSGGKKNHGIKGVGEPNQLGPQEAEDLLRRAPQTRDNHVPPAE